MTEPGETDGFTVSDHIRAIDTACGQSMFDAVLVQRRPPSALAQERYSRVGSEPVLIDREAIIASGRRIVLSNVIEESDAGAVRHSPTPLSASAHALVFPRHGHSLGRGGQRAGEHGGKGDGEMKIANPAD
jgi:2-phospho-L-lactate transferase/gluconeogenesis factor (CofD/UPF0052 family)